MELDHRKRRLSDVLSDGPKPYGTSQRLARAEAKFFALIRCLHSHPTRPSPRRWRSSPNSKVLTVEVRALNRQQQ